MVKKRMNAARSSELLVCFFIIKIKKAAAGSSANGKYLCDVLCSYKLAVGNTLKFCLVVTEDYRLKC